MEETGLNITKYELFDVNSASPIWYRDNMTVNVHHIGIFYKILEYKNKVKKNIQIDEINDDSLGAQFYDIASLTKDQLSAIAILELESLGYNIK